MSLSDASVLVVGVGGLGCPAAIGLANGGVRRIGLIDPDKVELSNLPRQTLYGSSDIGRMKVVVAAQRLRLKFPAIEFMEYPIELTRLTFHEIAGQFQFAIDGTDQIATKYLINDQSVATGLPYVHAGVGGFQAQLMTVVPGQSACLRCVFPDQTDLEEVPTCREAGVLGGLVGSFGYMQAAEAVAFLEGRELCTNRLLTYDGTRARWRTITVRPSLHCRVCSTLPRFETRNKVRP